MSIIDWYERRHELYPGMVFDNLYGELVRLDRRVPGDGTKWYIHEWDGISWFSMDNTIEPGELLTYYPEGKRDE